MGESISQVESSDLIAYGLIPEFVGRFPILVNLSALTEEQLVQVQFYFLQIVHLIRVMFSEAATYLVIFSSLSSYF